MASTKGHVTRVTGGDWHPTKKNEMLTCSVDGSVRIWDLYGKKSFDSLICQSVRTDLQPPISRCSHVRYLWRTGASYHCFRLCGKPLFIFLCVTFASNVAYAADHAHDTLCVYVLPLVGHEYEKFRLAG